MRRVIRAVLGLCILGSLCACGAEDTGTGEPSRQVLAAVSVMVEDISPYQSYTLSPNGTILDTETGLEIQCPNLSADKQGNIIWNKSRQVLVTAEQVQANWGKMAESQPESSQPEPPAPEKEVSSSSAPPKKPSTPTPPPASSKPNETGGQDDQCLPDEKNMNINHPIQGDREWIFYSTDPANRDPTWNFEPDYQGPVMSLYRIKINANDSTTINYEMYLPVEGYPYQRYDSDIIITLDGKQYIWQRTSHFTGTSFPVCDGTVDIALKCYDSFGNFLVDDLVFVREGPNALVLKSYRPYSSHPAFYLQPGNTFRR